MKKGKGRGMVSTKSTCKRASSRSARHYKLKRRSAVTIPYNMADDMADLADSLRRANE